MACLAQRFRVVLFTCLLAATSALAGQNAGQLKMGGLKRLPNNLPEERIHVDVTKRFSVRLRWQVNQWTPDMTGHVLTRVELDEAGQESGDAVQVGPDAIGPDFSDEFLSQPGLEEIQRLKAAGELTNPTTEEALRQFCKPLERYKMNKIASRLFHWARVFGLGIVDSHAVPGKTYVYKLHRVVSREGGTRVEPQTFLSKKVTVRYPFCPPPPLEAFTASRHTGEKGLVEVNWSISADWFVQHGRSREFLLFAYTGDDAKGEVVETIDWYQGDKSKDGKVYEFDGDHRNAPSTPVRYAVASVNVFDRPTLPSITAAVAAASEPAMGIEQVKLVRRDGGILITWRTEDKKKPRGLKGFRVFRGSRATGEPFKRPALCLTEKLLPWDQKWFFDKSFDANKEAGRMVRYLVTLEAAKVKGFSEYITMPLKIPYPDPIPPRDLSARTEVRDGKPWAVVRWQPVEFPGAKATRIRYMEHAVGEWKEGALVEKGTSCEFALDTDPDGGLVVFSAHGVNVKYMEGKLDTRVRLTVPPYGELAPAAYTKTGQVADHLHLEWKYPMKEYLTGFRLLDGAKVLLDEKTLGPFERQADLYGLAPGTYTLSLVAVDRLGRVSAPQAAEVVMRPLKAPAQKE